MRAREFVNEIASPEEQTVIPDPQTRVNLIALWDKFARENPKVKWVLDMLPGSGQVASGIDVASLVDKGEYGQAAIAALGLAPMVKPLLKLQSFGLTPQQMLNHTALLKTSQRARNVDRTVDTTQAVDQSRLNTRPIANIGENFADGKVKGKSRPGRVKRSGASCSGSESELRARAKKYSGERGRMYHWCANMKSGRD